MRNHRGRHVDAPFARYIEIVGSKMYDQPIALDLMASVIRMQIFMGFFGTEFTFMASHKKKGLPRIYK
jgi:hypothetical protein